MLRPFMIMMFSNFFLRWYFDKFDPIKGKKDLLSAFNKELVLRSCFFGSKVEFYLLSELD